MLELRSLGLKHNRWVLRGINLSFSEGQIYGIIGKSGAGKTSLLKLTAGLQDTSEGGVYFEGKQLIGPSEKLIPGYDDIQLVNQDFALEPYHTVEQNVREKILSRHKHDQVALINEFLNLVELDHVRDQQAKSLSGGEQQRLALARALACEPKVLLLDEPFVHLDQRLRWKVLNYLKKLNEEMGTTIVLVSHDGAEMMGFVQELIYLEEGQIARKGNAREMYYHPENRIEAQFLGEINEIELDGKRVLFRPNEYTVGEGVKVKFLSAIDTGVTYFNYFETENGERILLYNTLEMKEVSEIEVNKRK